MVLWLPTSSIIKNISSLIINNRLENSPTFKFTNRVSQMPCEKVHLSFLKWSLGVHRKASNIGTWGESGRYPLLYQSIKLTLKYFQRIDNMKTASFVKAALQEQKIMNLSWYKKHENSTEIGQSLSHGSCLGIQIYTSRERNHY